MRSRRALLAVALLAGLVAIAVVSGLLDADRLLAAVGVGGGASGTSDAPPAAVEDLPKGDGTAPPALAAGGPRRTTASGDERADGAGTKADATAASPAAPTALDGSVLRADGRPAAGARVTLIASDGTTITAAVDGDGRFHLDARRGRYDLLVRAGFDGSLFLRDVFVDGRPLDAPLELAAAAEVRVEATQEERPLVGAAVRLQFVADGAAPRTVADGRTDRDGRFVADGLPQGPYAVEVDAAPGATASKRGDVTGTTTFVVALAATGRWTGRVTDATTGTPVPATVTLVVMAGDGTFVRGETVADSGGVFALAVPRGRPRQVLVEHADYSPYPASDGPAAVGALAALRTEDVHRDVALVRGGAARGLVTNADSKAPVAAIALRFVPRRRGGVRTATTAADGTYEVRGVAPGDWSVVVETAGWYASDPATLSVPDPGADRAPSDVRLDLAVRSSGRIAGQVQRPDATPVARAHVWLVGGSGLVRAARDAGRTLETFTDAAGAFDLDDVPPADAVRVRASLGDAEATPSPPIRAADGPAPLVLVLMPTGTIRGRVLDAATHEPVAGARVRLDPAGEPGGRGGRAVNTGADGRYEAAALVPGGWSIVASRRRDFLPAAPTAATLSPEALSTEVALTLDPGLSIAGTVVDADGKPVAGARLILTGAEDAGTPPPAVWRNAGSAADGSFRLPALRPGSYAIEARLGGQVRGRVDRLRGGESHVVVVARAL